MGVGHGVGAEAAKGGLEAAKYLVLISALRLGLIARRLLGCEMMLTMSAVGGASRLLLTFCNDRKPHRSFAAVLCHILVP